MVQRYKIEHIFKVLVGDNDHLNVDDALVSKKSEFIQEFFRLDKNYDTSLEKNEMINGMKALEIKIEFCQFIINRFEICHISR